MECELKGHSAIFPQVNIDFLTRIISMKGVSCSVEVKKFYQEIEVKISQGLTKLIQKEVLFSCELQYINTASTLEIIRLICLISNYAKIVNVEWLYEEDDEDTRECGIFIKDQVLILGVKNCNIVLVTKE